MSIADWTTDEHQHQVVLDVIKERIRQDTKWGNQDHKSDLLWFAILAEEFGELAKSMLDAGGGGDAGLPDYEELIQTAAVAVAWAEAMRRR